MIGPTLLILYREYYAEADKIKTLQLDNITGVSYIYLTLYCSFGAHCAHLVLSEVSCKGTMLIYGQSRLKCASCSYAIVFV